MGERGRTEAAEDCPTRRQPEKTTETNSWDGLAEKNSSVLWRNGQAATRIPCGGGSFTTNNTTTTTR